MSAIILWSFADDPFLLLQSKVELLADFQHVDFCGVAEELRKTNSVNGIVLEDKVIIYKT